MSLWNENRDDKYVWQSVSLFVEMGITLSRMQLTLGGVVCAGDINQHADQHLPPRASSKGMLR